MTDRDVTDDTLLGGRVKVKQPGKGYRVSIDPVLLAAAVSADKGAMVADMGAGVGAAALCLACREPSVRVTGFEVSVTAVALARENAVTNRVEDRVIFEQADILDSRNLPETAFDQVLSNPPFYLAGKGTASPDSNWEQAVRLGADDIERWIRATAKVLRHGGYATFVFPADRLEALLKAMTSRFGGFRIYPLWKQAGAAAGRVIVQGRKGSAASTRLLSGMALHADDGAFTEEADLILRHAQAILLDQ